MRRARSTTLCLATARPSAYAIINWMSPEPDARYMIQRLPPHTKGPFSLPIDGRQAAGDGADHQGRLNGRRAVGKIDECVFT